LKWCCLFTVVVCHCRQTTWPAHVRYANFSAFRLFFTFGFQEADHLPGLKKRSKSTLFADSDNESEAEPSTRDTQDLRKNSQVLFIASLLHSIFGQPWLFLPVSRCDGASRHMPTARSQEVLQKGTSNNRVNPVERGTFIYWCLPDLLVDLAFLSLRVRISHEKPQLKRESKLLLIVLRKQAQAHPVNQK